MSLALRPAGRARPLAGLLSRAGSFVLLVAAGVALGLQYTAPNKRVIAVSVAVILFGVAWRIDMVSGLGVMALALPFPRTTVFGNTNLAFVLLVLVLWLLRVTQRQCAPPRRTPLDAPMVALFIAYVVSFYNVNGGLDLAMAFFRFEVITASMLMCALISRNLHTEQDFRRLLNFQAVSVLVVCLLAVFELNHPGAAVIPGWITFAGTETPEINLHNVRVGSAFFDYELLSEFCALNGLFVLFLTLRAKSVSRRVLYGALLVLVVFVLFTTVTRGAFIALAIGLLYLLWIVRRRVRFVGLVTMTVAVLTLFLGMNLYVSRYTRSGSIIERFTTGQQFVHGMPANRQGTWSGAYQRMLEHPLIGHGPYYSIQSGTRTWTWPHCLYLMVGNNVGFIGLGIYLWMLWTLFRMSRPPTDDLRRGPYVQSYLSIARVQLVVFLVDEIKIEYLRNSIYQFQIWMMFSLIVAAYQITRSSTPIAPAGVSVESRA